MEINMQCVICRNMEIYRDIKLNDSGISKIKEARESEPAAFPEWFDKELADAGTDSE